MHEDVKDSRPKVASQGDSARNNAMVLRESVNIGDATINASEFRSVGVHAIVNAGGLMD
jgi:hypothetical protein